MIQLAVWSVLYWFAAALVLVGIIFGMGDCGTAEDEARVQQCADGRHYVSWTIVLVAIAFYGFLLWPRYRKPPLR